MPVQNVGTLLFSIVALETGVVLAEPGRTVDVLSAFSMPPVAEWRPHTQNVGFGPSEFAAVLAHCGDPARGRPVLGELLGLCLRDEHRGGPNVALLLGLLFGTLGVRSRMWLNDVAEGRYGNALPELTSMPAHVRRLLTDGVPLPEVAVSGDHFPASIPHLRETLRAWPEPAARIALLDPDCYGKEIGGEARVDAAGHRRWLNALRGDVPTLAIIFTAQQSLAQRVRTIDALHQDGVVNSFCKSATFVRQHYVVHVATNDDPLLDRVVRAVRLAWALWFEAYAPGRRADLALYLNGAAMM